MKKIILLIWICGMMGGEVKGQGNEKFSSVNCPPVYPVIPDQMFGLYFDTTGYFYYDVCNGWSPTICGENIIRFTAQCSNNYILEMNSPHWAGVFPVAIKVSSLAYCDSTGYTCLTPYNSVYLNPWYKHYYYLTVDSNTTYDIVIDYDCAGTYEPPYTLGFLIRTPHVSNVQFYDITSDSISLSWDGIFDDMVLEYGPKDFIPGSDTTAGTNGILLHNPNSPVTITGLIPDSIYDFYFRDKCGVFSLNSAMHRQRTAKDPATIPWLGCNSVFGFTYYASTAAPSGAWALTNCIGQVHTSQEKILKFICDSSAVHTIDHSLNSTPAMGFIGVYYKKASYGINEHNWTCAGYGGNVSAWSVNTGPLEKDTLYYIMVKGQQTVPGGVQGQTFSLSCPSPLCSTAPTSINSNATNNTICSGQSVTLTQVGGVLSANGAFYWYADSCGGTSLGTGYSKTFSPSDTTTYYVRAEDTCGVTACASITINVNPSPAPPTITGDTTICQGTSTILTASGGYACYLWSMASTTQSVNVSNAGTYVVTVCDANGCTASASVVVTVYPNPIPVITGNTTSAQGNSTTLNAGAGYTSYLWSTATTTQTINVSSANVYTVTVTNAFACSGSASVTVTVNPNPVPVISGNTTFCQGGSTVLDAGAGYANYQWSTGSGTQTIIVVNTGPYTVWVTDANGCTGSASITVTVLPLPSATISGNAAISGNCTNLTVSFTGTPPFTYSYSNGTVTFGPFATAANPVQITVCPNFTTVYTLVSVTGTGCQGIVSGSATITVVPNPVAVITPSAATYICLGDTVHFTANTGTGFTYQWYKNSIPISGAVNSFYDAYANGLYSFALTDSNGCYSISSSALVQIICFPPIEPADLRIANELNDDIVLIPNPANDELTVISNQFGASAELKITDTKGRLYLRTTNSKLPVKININHFSKGIYFVEINDGKEKVVRKFVKE